MKKNILIFSWLLLAAAAARAGVTGAQFLRIDTDARLSGMASAGMASAYGINSLNYNPAGLSAITGAEVAFSHSKWLMDSNHDFVGFGFAVKRKGPEAAAPRRCGPTCWISAAGRSSTWSSAWD